MYLYKKTPVDTEEKTDPKDRFSIRIKRGGKKYNAINKNRITEITEEVIYWRKVNAVHKWFVDNIQDGIDNDYEYYAPVFKLKELLDKCELVLEEPKTAPKHLPTLNGFFFGNIEYNEDYFNGITYTRDMLKQILAEDNDGRFYYQSLW